MNSLVREILRELYEKDRFFSVSELETLTGRDPGEVRKSLAELKDMHYVREREDFFEISEEGRAHAQSQWL